MNHERPERVKFTTAAINRDSIRLEEKTQALGRPSSSQLYDGNAAITGERDPVW